jgi:hypothetical protein
MTLTKSVQSVSERQKTAWYFLVKEAFQGAHIDMISLNRERNAFEEYKCY